MPTTTYTVPVTGVDPVAVTVTDYGTGQPFLLLHGGVGPQSVTAFAELLATTHDAHVLVPVHPGFGGTRRPDGLAGVPALARLYNGLIGQLGLDDVTVIGNSLGGWIAAEIALLRSPRVSGIVLIDAVGIDVEARPGTQSRATRLDPLIAPAWVLPRHLLDQQRDPRVDRRASSPAGAGPPPADQPLVPAQQRARRHQPTHPHRHGQQRGQGREHRPIRPVKLRPGVLPPQHGDLVAQHQ
jgi:pimeloyl-ACP methyl ester carboxylesterase